jgi:hypothetical protein
MKSLFRLYNDCVIQRATIMSLSTLNNTASVTLSFNDIQLQDRLNAQPVYVGAKRWISPALRTGTKYWEMEQFWCATYQGQEIVNWFRLTEIYRKLMFT